MNPYIGPHKEYYRHLHLNLTGGDPKQNNYTSNQLTQLTSYNFNQNTFKQN